MIPANNGKPRQRKRRRPGRRKSFWREVLAERRREGLTYRETAARHGVSQSQLYKWAKALKGGARKASSLAARDTVGFVEIDAPESWRWPAQGEYRVQFPNGLVLSVPIHVAEAKVASVISNVMRETIGQK